MDNTYVGRLRKGGLEKLTLRGGLVLKCHIRRSCGMGMAMGNWKVDWQELERSLIVNQEATKF